MAILKTILSWYWPNERSGCWIEEGGNKNLSKQWNCSHAHNVFCWIFPIGILWPKLFHKQFVNFNLLQIDFELGPNNFIRFPLFPISALNLYHFQLTIGMGSFSSVFEIVLVPICERMQSTALEIKSWSTMVCGN